jgi:hypothetical protein
VGGVWQSREIYIIATRKKRKEIQKEATQDTAPKERSLVTFFLQVGSTFYLSPLPNNAIILQIHEGINPFLRSESL